LFFYNSNLSKHYFLYFTIYLFFYNSKLSTLFSVFYYLPVFLQL
jgi:hypothetical protein